MSTTGTEGTRELSFLESIKILFGASRGFWLVNMINFGDGIAYFGILTLLTRFLGTRLGLPDHLTGISVSWFTGLVTLFMFGGGFVSDKLGVRGGITLSVGLLLLGRIVTTLSPAAIAFFETMGFSTTGTIAETMRFVTGGTIAETMGYATAWAGLFFMALGSGILQPALYAGTKEYTDPRTATVGFGMLYAIMNLGIVGENFLSPFVRTPEVDFYGLKVKGLNWGIDGVFWMCVGITAFMFLVHILMFTSHVEKTQRIGATEPEQSTAEDAKKTWKDRILELPFLDPRFMFFIFILLPVRTLFAHQFLTMPDYVFRAYPEAVSAKFEWINGLNPLIIVVGVPLIAAWTRKVNIINMMIIGTTISALTTFLLVPGPNLTMLLWYVILFSIGEAVWSSRFLEYTANLAPPGKVGAYMGLAGIPWFLAKFTTGFYSGFLLNKLVPAPLDTTTLLSYAGINETFTPYFLPILPESVMNQFLRIFATENSSTLWLIYGIFACVSPVGLILGKKWIERANKTAADKA